MYFKLAIKNIVKRKHDYLIYFISVMLVVAFMYSYMLLAFSGDIREMMSSFSQFNKAVVVISVFVALTGGFMISYTINYILLRRKKEIAIYMLMGMEEKTICHVFSYENLIIGLIALVIGLIAGTGISIGLKTMIANIFSREKENVEIWNIPAVLVTVFLFFCMYFFALFKEVRTIKKSTIAMLLTESIRREKERTVSGVIWRIILFIILEAAAVGLLVFSFRISDNRALVLIGASAVLVLSGVFLCAGIIPDLIRLCSDKSAYKGTKLFLLAQIVSRGRTAGRVIRVSVLLITATLITTFMGFLMGGGYKTNIQADYPYDACVSFGANIESFDDVIDYVDKTDGVKDYVFFRLYKDENVDGDIITLSDYNAVRKLLGYKELTLTEGEFIIHSEEWFKHEKLRNSFGGSEGISVGGRTLKMAETIYDEPMEQSRMVGRNGYVVVVADACAENLATDESRLVMSLKNAERAQLRDDLNRFVRKEWMPVINSEIKGNVTISVSVKAWGVANSLSGFVTLSFCGFYLGAILMVITGMLVSLNQLDRVDLSLRYYTILDKIGVSPKMLKNSAVKEITCFFALPLIFPLLVFALVIVLSKQILSKYILSPTAVPHAALFALGTVLGIYVLYYLVVKFLYKKAVLP